MKNVLCVMALAMFMLAACAGVLPAVTSTPTSTLGPSPTATEAATATAAATATEAPTATPEIQISPSDAEFLNYNIPTEAFFDGSLIKKLHEMPWPDFGPNTKFPNMDWYEFRELMYIKGSAPHFSDDGSESSQRRVIGFNVTSGDKSMITATRQQVKGLDPKHYPIIIGVWSGSDDNSLKTAQEIYTQKMKYSVFIASKSGEFDGSLAEEYSAQGQNRDNILSAFKRLDSFENGGVNGVTDFTAWKDLDGAVLPLDIRLNIVSGWQYYQ